MKFTVRVKLMLGYAAVLSLMILVSVLAYLSLDYVNKSASQILVHAHKYDVVEELRRSLRQFLDINDYLIRGELRDAEYYQSLGRDVEKKIVYVGKLRLKDTEKAFLAKISSGFNLLKKMGEESLEWEAARRSADSSSLLRDTDKAKQVILSNVGGLYDEAWRSLDRATITIDHARETGIQRIILFSLIAIAAGIAISIYTSYRITTPIRALSRAVSEVATGKMDQKVNRTTGDEVGELVVAFNQMVIDLKGYRDQIERYNKELQEMIDNKTAELEKTKEYLESILEHSGDMIITTTLFDEIVQFNKGAENILGYSRDVIVGTRIEALFVDKHDYKKLRKKVVEDGEVITRDTRMMKKTGDIVSVSLTLSRLKDRLRNVIGLVGIGRAV